MSSKLFDSDDYKNVETATKALLSLEPNFLSVRGTSPRSVGDALQEIVAERLQTVLPLYIRGYRNNFERRAMADIAFNDDENNQYVIDVKTHLVSATFGMPNLTSVERLANFYENNRHYFVVLSISYELVQTNLSILDVKFVPIEFLGWDCLTIGALGTGQIQIANARRITVNPHFSRKAWMLTFFDRLIAFYEKEKIKTDRRLEDTITRQSQWILRNE